MFYSVSGAPNQIPPELLRPWESVCIISSATVSKRQREPHSAATRSTRWWQIVRRIFKLQRQFDKMIKHLFNAEGQTAIVG